MPGIQRPWNCSRAWVKAHPISTESKLAQKFFDQGLTLVYGFNHDEAARLFARAAEFDPKSPMPHWGIALALGPNYNLPAAARARSESLDSHRTCQ